MVDNTSSLNFVNSSWGTAQIIADAAGYYLWQAPGTITTTTATSGLEPGARSVHPEALRPSLERVTTARLAARIAEGHGKP